MNVVCSPLSIAVNPPVDLQYVLFGRPALPTMGAAGPTMLGDVKGFQIQPDKRAWDLLTLALSVAAADEGCPRDKSPDGWTREIALSVAVNEPSFWRSEKEHIELMLRFLTGDIWTLDFQKGGVMPVRVAAKDRRISVEDCVCLLSGGADSLTGAIDAVADGKNPLFISQVSKGDKTHQSYFATMIAGANHHLQLNHNIKVPGNSERSQRARSMIFLAYGVIAANCLDRYAAGESVTILIPENGVISINVPLTPLRRGTLSTRTTHPFYLGLYQQLLDRAGLRIALKNPYQFKTKGEIFKSCKNQDLLKRLLCQSTSCGRFARMGFKHCGRCVPCLIRRAGIYAFGLNDDTKYVYSNLALNDKEHKRFDDVMSACFAVETVKRNGIDAWIGGALSTTQVGDIAPYRETLTRGLKELSAFLKHIGAL